MNPLIMKQVQGVPVTEAEAPERAQIQRWYAVIVLTLIFTVHSLDRQLISIVLEPIKTTFHLSDAALGFLAGTVYAVSFSLAGIPMGMLVDRMSRRNILGTAVFLWSSATALGGLATSYLQLVLARIGLGIFEGPSLPASASMISDLVPPRQRATALGIYAMGLGLGQIIGFVFGAMVAAHWGWREVFFIGGLPGMLLAIVLFATVKEPARRSLEGVVEKTSDAPTLAETLRFIWSQASLVRYFTAYVLMVLATAATLSFLPSFYLRTHGLALRDVGLIVGLGFGLATILGSLLGGLLMDRLGKRGMQWVPRFGACSALVMAIASVGMIMSPSVLLSVILLVVWGLAFMAQVAPFYAMSQSLVRTRMRGTTLGTLNTLVNVIAYGLGAPIAGLLSDWYAPWAGGEALRYALCSVALLSLVAAFWYRRVGRTLHSDLERVKKE